MKQSRKLFSVVIEFNRAQGGGRTIHQKPAARPRWLSILAAVALIGACAGDDQQLPAAPSPGSGAAPNNGSEDVSAPANGPSATSGGSDLPCPYEGPPVVDTSTLQACPAEVCGGGGHCVPTTLLEPDQAAPLADCDAMSKCVPDDFIVTMGNFIPATCKSLMGNEGRCLSTCIPDVAARADMLPQDICKENERCAPCYDPITVEDSGACTQSCDPGPAEPAPAPLPTCCDNDNGTCLPTAAVPPDQQDKLGEDSCPQDGDAMLCIPNELLDPAFVPDHCETGGLIQFFYGDEYKEGACYPECLDAVQQFGIGGGSCPDGFKCAPCKDPQNNGAPSGACPWYP